MTSCRSFTKANVGLDHQLLLAGIKLKLRNITRQYTMQTFDVEKLNDAVLSQEFGTVLEEKQQVVILPIQLKIFGIT